MSIEEFEDVDLLNSDNEEEEDKMEAVGHEKKKELEKKTDPNEEIAKNASLRVNELVSDPPHDWGVRVKADEMTDMICKMLNESKRITVLRAVKRMGNIVSNKLLRHVLAIEACGGIKVNDGTRRREPGGVFWWLVKREVSSDDLKFIFAADKEKQRNIRRRRRRAQLKDARVRRTKNRNQKMRNKSKKKQTPRETYKEKSKKFVLSS